MKISKSVLGAVVAATLIFGSAATTGAIGATATPAPVVTPSPISTNVAKHDKKVILEARKSARELERRVAKLENQATNAVYQEALVAWRLANADYLTARKAIFETYKATIKAAQQSVHEAKTALDKAHAREALAVVVANATGARTDAIAALGEQPKKPVKPAMGNGGTKKNKKD